MTARRTDACQVPIVRALRAAGCIVSLTHGVGSGFPDIVVWSPFLRRFVLMECKVPCAGLTPCEQDWHERHGAATEAGAVCIVHDAQEALQAVGAIE